MPSMASRSSLSSWSSTPQVKAPWAPPPCSARLMCLTFGAGARPGNSDERILIMRWRRSRRGPAAVDGQIGAGDRLRRVRAEVDGKARDLVDGDEFLGRLLRQDHIA